MSKPIKLNESKLDAISSFADNIGELYDDIAKMPNRIRKIAIGLSLDGDPTSNRFIKIASPTIESIINKLDANVSDDEYFDRLEKLVDGKSDAVKIIVCQKIILSLVDDIAAKKNIISKLEERILLSDDSNSSEVKVAEKRRLVFKNNLTIREGRKIRMLEYFFKLRHCMIKAIEKSTDEIISCIVTGDKYTQELSKRYEISKMIESVVRKENIFNNTKGE